jgi:hypothetical protein
MQKKMGEVVYKGHYSYSLMLELQLGIRYSVGRALSPRHSCSTSSLAGALGLGSFGPWGLVLGLSGSSGLLSSQGKKQQRGQQRLEKKQQLLNADEVKELVQDDFREKVTVYFPSCGR